MSAQLTPLFLSFVIISLLVGDVFLPVPSSIISASSGVLLGFSLGSLVSTAGMTLGCIVGWLFGRWAAPVTIYKLVGDKSRLHFRALFQRYGLMAIVICRGVPVLAEASILLAGAANLSFLRFLMFCFCSNLGISVAYAAAASQGSQGNLVYLIFASVLLPGIAWSLHRWLARVLV